MDKTFFVFKNVSFFFEMMMINKKYEHYFNLLSSHSKKKYSTNILLDSGLPSIDLLKIITKMTDLAWTTNPRRIIVKNKQSIYLTKTNKIKHLSENFLIKWLFPSLCSMTPGLLKWLYLSKFIVFSFFAKYLITALINFFQEEKVTRKLWGKFG